MTDTNTADTRLELLLSLDRIIREAERARTLRDQLLATARPGADGRPRELARQTEGQRDSRPVWVDDLVVAIREATAVPPEARCLSREATASAIGVSVRTLDDLGTDGPPSFTIGARRLYPALELAKWIRRQIKA